MDDAMCYVAEDPTQPGAAWAAVVDDPGRAKDTAKDVASWIREGATVKHVPVETAREMLCKWERPAKQQPVLF